MDKLLTFLNAERGRLSSLAADLGITPGAINQWSRVPAERVVEIERLTGLPRQELRPDLYLGFAVTPADMDAARYEEALTSAAPECAP